jgi:hypothetical protein
MRIRVAKRSNVKLRIGIGGPSGSGKTMSALLMAYGMTGDWKKVCIIDSEDGRGDFYPKTSGINDGNGTISNIGEYMYIRVDEFKNPSTGRYEVDGIKSPERYIAAIKAAEDEGCEVIIIDSISHEWDWCLKRQSDLGGKFSDWGKVTPIHNSFLKAMLSSKSHIITTVRKETKYIQTEENGKTKVVKIGLDDKFRSGFEYELTLRFDIDMNHLITIQKDNTNRFGSLNYTVVNPSVGKILIDYVNETLDKSDESNESSLPVDDGTESLKRVLMIEASAMIENTSSIDNLKQVYDTYPDLHGVTAFTELLGKRKKELAN